jgi:signal transduction histidine kinase
LALAGGGLAWFLVGRVLSPYGELLEEARRFSGRMGGGPEDVFLVSTFRQAVQRVEEQERELAARAQELSELSAGLAHELRNNLSVMEGYLRLARENPQELARYLQVLAAEVQAQREFLERFMTFVRPVAAQKTTFRLGPLVTQVASRLASAFPQVKLECVGDAELVADPTAVRVVLENLLRNACEAASRRADGRVKATVQLEARKVQVVVEDNGPGIPEDQRGTLFEPFVSQKPAGGIGLALARRLARAMGGEVELVSAREPTAFVARFPQEASP